MGHIEDGLRREPQTYSDFVARKSALRTRDPEVFGILEDAAREQDTSLLLVPSSNYISKAVMEALGSPLTNIYAEGEINKRYYQGTKNADRIEQVAKDRAQELFGYPHINVQSLSGSPANTAAQIAISQFGDRIMGLSLKSGGHLTHGNEPQTFSSRWFRNNQYNVGEDGLINYDDLEKQAMEYNPHVLFFGTTSYPYELDWERLRDIADKSGAVALVADISHTAGLVAGGQHQNPGEFADIVTTTTHKSLRGPRGAIIGITERGLAQNPKLGEKVDKAVFPGLQGGPHIHTIAAMAVALREAQDPQFIEYARQTVANAQELAWSLQAKGHKLVGGGTGNHLLVMELNEYLLGNTAAEALEFAGLTANRNTIPTDESPFYPTGLRMGTPAITTRGLKESHMEQIAGWTTEVLDSLTDSARDSGIDRTAQRSKNNRVAIIESSNPTIIRVRRQVAELCEQNPILGFVERPLLPGENPHDDGLDYYDGVTPTERALIARRKITQG